MPQLKHPGFRRCERGFTLSEVLITIILMGIVFGIATSSWLGLIESREVDSATNQVVSDLRLAHSSATNRLGTAKLIFSNTGAAVTCNAVSADYCLVKPVDAGTQSIPRSLPDNTVVNSPNILADADGSTSTIELASDGSARAVGTLGSVGGVTDNCPAGTPTGVPTIQVTSSSDGDPAHCLTFNTATSKVEVD